MNRWGSGYIDRLTLDLLRAARAASRPGVTFRQGFRVTRVLREGGGGAGVAGHSVEAPDAAVEFRAPVTLACDGLRSVFHDACGFRRRLLPRKRWGVVGHVQARLDPVVEIVFFEGGQLFAAPCGPEEATATLLLEERAVARFAGRAQEAYRETLGRLGLPAQPTTDVAVVGPLGFSVDSVWRPGLLLVGDSAGFYDPITGEGMSAAVLGALEAAAAVRRGFEENDFEAPFRRYEQKRAALLRDIIRLTALLLRAAGRVRSVERLLDRLSDRPALVGKLMGVASGRNRWDALSLGERFLLWTGIGFGG